VRDAWWCDEQDSGPPSIADDAWFTHHVASLNYPPPKRDPAPYPGQTTLTDHLEA
jgi:hypothetical protein